MLPLSVKKHIRKEKARIRREFLSLGEQEEQIKKVYQKFEHVPLLPKEEPKKVDVKKVKPQIKAKTTSVIKQKTTKTNIKKIDKAKRKTKKIAK